jgi:hypothetical protein
LKSVIADDRIDGLYRDSTAVQDGSLTSNWSGSGACQGDGGELGETNETRKGKGVWWNYFKVGLDFLVDDQEGLVRKIMVHSNIVSFGSVCFTS